MQGWAGLGSHQGSLVSAGCVRALSLPTLGDPTDCSPPGASVHGIFQARVLEWVLISFCKGLPTQDRIHVSYVSRIGRGVLHHEHHLGSPTGGCWVFLSLILATVDDPSKSISPQRVENKDLQILTLFT